jgi:Sigma-70, region 4
MSMAWASLSNADREILRLVAWEGLGPTDGAAVLGCSVSSYKVRLHRARRRLERRFGSLLDEGMPTSDIPPKDLQHKAVRLDGPRQTKRILDGHTEGEIRQ